MAGPRAGAARDEALRAFADRYRSSFRAALRERPELRMPTDDALFILSAGVDQLICARVRAGALDHAARPDRRAHAHRRRVPRRRGGDQPHTPEGGS